jgi:Tannase and feruloyl esterase
MQFDDDPQSAEARRCSRTPGALLAADIRRRASAQLRDIGSGVLQKRKKGKGREGMTTYEKPTATTIRWLGALVALAATAAMTATAAKADSCSKLANTFHRPKTLITSAQTIPAGTFATPTTPPGNLSGLPQFCRVTGFTAPTNDSQIGFEVWIPETGWNSKYLQVGCGGFCGSISYNAMAEPLRRGYAVAATDDGHLASGIDASWANGHPEKLVDFGYRALKETTDVAKELVMDYKLSGPRRSYFMGCSDGGREALMEAQRFPRDFDGIIAGSPANYWTHLFTGFVWDEQALSTTATGDLSQVDLNVLSTAALAQCVGRDGGLSTDQFLNNPPACRFDPGRLRCNGGNAGACLSQDKVSALEKIFSGPTSIFPGYGPGGEANVFADWPLWITDTTNPAVSLQGFFGNSFFQNMVFPNSGWTPSTFSAADNARQADARVGAILNSIDPDLNQFKSRGGKLIQYAGWSNSAISPHNDIDYYNSVTKVMEGRERTAEFYRLFMVPGMAHCGGGPGANAFGQGTNGPNPSDPADDILSALDHWVESGTAPESIIATKYVNDNPAQGIAFQRPLCSYPKFASRKGPGTSSFVCVRGRDDDDRDDNDREKRADR